MRELRLCVACAAQLPEMRKLARRDGLAFRFCVQYHTHATVFEGRLTLQDCATLGSARSIEAAMRAAYMRGGY